MEELRLAVLHAIDTAPCSERALARAAGVSHTLLQQIRAGERSATGDVALAIAAALEEMGADCMTAAERIRGVAEGRRG